MEPRQNIEKARPEIETAEIEGRELVVVKLLPLQRE
jgi:hypothetical protein